jgi:Lon protease-like protein
MVKMFELPLFPLNTVLFPGMPINLHIFEDRYKEMINACIQNNQPFGVVLIRNGTEALGPLAEPYPVGCTAQIAQVEQLENGQMGILAVGLERFQIRELTYDKPYLVGTVELFPMDGADQPVLTQASDRLRPWVEEYLSVLAQADEEVEFDPTRLPHDPLALAYLAASLVQIPTVQKQTLLAADRAAELLTDIRSIYRREVALLNVIMERDKREEAGLFSLN